MRAFPIMACLALSACATLPPDAPPAALTPAFDPLAFFAGRTEGRGRLTIAFHRGVAILVHGSGTIEPDGAIHLTQAVVVDGKPPTRRDWRIARSLDGTYRGTLSDARGPVTVIARGNRLHIRFAMAHGLSAEQWLVLEPGGQSTLNRLTVRKLGVVVARVDERIVRVPQGAAMSYPPAQPSVAASIAVAAPVSR
ncbi:DUF3833 family protein [Sphingomonas bacterium]|uniref:DUF3833 family protein n=1 Tax=Sphingomonas bacterium TaxID=1895847 RepID=UPI00157762A5|nr:DUF3833 family protein [Sphingomonas bacterium]